MIITRLIHIPSLRLFVALAVLLQGVAVAAAQRLEAITPGRIVIDGKFGDWTAVAASVIDPGDAPEAFVDFGEVRVTCDEHFVHVLIDFGRTVNVQGLPGQVMLLFDADGDSKTGSTQFEMHGVDIAIDLSPAQAKANQRNANYGIGLRAFSETAPEGGAAGNELPLNPYDIGFAFAPTHASRRFEFRVKRASPIPGLSPLFDGNRFACKFVAVDQKGDVVDQTSVIDCTCNGRAKAPTAIEQESDPLERPGGTALRVMCWNVQRGSIFKTPEPFIRTLRAVRPDVLALVELTESNSAEQVQSFLDSALPDDVQPRWKVAFGSGGGDLRCAVATHFAIRESPQTKFIPLPNHPERSVRAVGANVELHDRRFLIVAVHLKCCGRAGGPEDETRKAEARGIHDAIQAACAATRIDGVVVAGDFNLVGSRDPLELLAAGIDTDRSALAPVDAYQIDGLSNATWEDPKEPFAPGRLDYMLFSDSTIRALSSLVFDSRDLARRWLEKNDLHSDDTRQASDHLPIVADFVWSQRP